VVSVLGVVWVWGTEAEGGLPRRVRGELHQRAQTGSGAEVLHGKIVRGG